MNDVVGADTASVCHTVTLENIVANCVGFNQTDGSASNGQSGCPMKKTKINGSAKCPWNDEKWPLVRIPADIHRIFALPAHDHHEPYLYMKAGQPARMNDALKEISSAGPQVEDGVLRAKHMIKKGVNPDVIRHALGIYLTHSADAQRRKITVPPLKDHAMIVNKNATSTIGQKLTIEAGEVVTPDTMQGPAILSYWREDYDYNDHHVHWHMVFPGTGMVVNGKNVKVIDRQGELFLYMHSQMVARYETEGICWGLPIVRPWNQYDDILEAGYTPVPALNQFYGSYPTFSSWWATKNPNIPETKDQPMPRATLEKWRDNIYQAIRDGFFYTKKPDGSQGKVELNPENCHNLVGTVIEAESAALQILDDGSTLDAGDPGTMYGNLHNFGHDKFAEMGYHNYLTKDNPYSLMISNFGSPRDAAFWPWHKHIQYFGRLSAARFPQDVTKYRAEVRLASLVLQPQHLNQPGDNKQTGITTKLGPPAVNLMESKAKLDHEPYQWSVQIASTQSPAPTSDKPQVITLRFFIAARKLMSDYQNWIEMDKVSVTLTSSASKSVTRLDTDSTVSRKMGNYSELDAQWASSWCRCGWPQNMMLPVGTPQGMDFLAFCMATNDVVDNVDVKTPALSYCGSMQNDRKYPDPRGMGYPFNREWTQLVAAPRSSSTPGGKEQPSKIEDIITDSATYPYMASSSFQILRTTKPFLERTSGPHPTTKATWFDTIKGYFLGSDVVCMQNEYGYDLSDYNDVVLHGAAIYDAVLHKRMPLQMPPYTQENPDPNHPMWSDEKCAAFNGWMEAGCPKGTPPGPGPGPTPTDISWDKTIKAYFLPADVQCMKRSFDLSNKTDVAKFADAIYEQVSTGKMPLQMEPYTQAKPDPAHPLWSKQMCANFKEWQTGGFP